MNQYLLREIFLQNAMATIITENKKKVGISKTTYSARGFPSKPPTGHKKQKTIRKMQMQTKSIAMKNITGIVLFMTNRSYKIIPTKMRIRNKSKQ